jgi:hypothetical protein
MESIRYFVEICNPLPRKFGRFATKGLPRVPARRAKTSVLLCETEDKSRGCTMVPNSQMRQIFMAKLNY